MKETVNASVAGIGFVFDRDAYEILNDYLSGLMAAYRGNPDGEEIVADIEARIVELILSRQGADAVVDRRLTGEIVGQLGEPEPAPGAAVPPAGPLEDGGHFPRRLYRDMVGSTLGGVCNGIARYFDIDPVLVRIGVFIPIFLLILLASLGFHALNGFLGSLFGSFVLLYFILWIVVPAARTPRQRLEMQGRRITASDIEREMNTGAVPVAGEKPRRGAWAGIFGFIGSVLLFVVKFTLSVIGTAFALAALALLVCIVGLLLGRPWMISADLELYLGGMHVSGNLFAALILAIFTIPIIMLVYQMIRAALHRRSSRALMWTLSGLWLLIVVFTTVTVLENTGEFFNWRGVRFAPARQRQTETDPVETARGWEIYERNVQAYRDSLENARLEAENDL